MGASPTIRRLLREIAELSPSSSNPTPTFHAAPVSDSNLHEWHFTLLGPPPPSPYAGGLYHGRIILPATYPLKPPNFRFLTPSGRFEVNREICLSISGFHEETWMPAWGVRTALTALRSFMAEKGTAGQVGGMEASKEVRARLAQASRGWRCEGCGRRSNEEVMKEWWETCKERGVKVEEEMGLEELPEGLSLEVREPKGRGEDDETVKETSSGEPHADISQTSASTRADSLLSSTESPVQGLQSPTLPASSDTPPQHRESDLLLDPSTSSGSHQPASAPAVQAPSPLSPQSPPTSPPRSNQRASRNAPPTSENGLQSMPPTPRTARSTTTSAAITVPAPDPVLDRETDPVTGTIDKAIGALFVALCIMILKKIFYPAASGTSMNDIYLSGD